MPKTRDPIRFKVRVAIGTSPSRGYTMAGFLDMMRYDAAIVVDWNTGDNHFEVTLESTNYTPARWRSMGLLPVEV